MGFIQLIRHGQASWGAADYDQLSELGYRQAAWLGQSWEAANYAPTGSVAGSMKRHGQTAVAAIDAIDGDLFDVDERWNEYDFVTMTEPGVAPDWSTDPRAFQAELDVALESWVGGQIDGSEPFADFSARVRAALDATVEQAGSGEHIAVFTSGGPIALVVSHLLTGDATLFTKLNRVVINASVTTIIVGRGGTQLLTFNEATHLPRRNITYR